MKQSISYRHKLLWKKYLRRIKRIKHGKRKKNVSKRNPNNIKTIPKNYIPIPSILSFKDNWSSTVKALFDIRIAIKYRFTNIIKNINIDHSRMEAISPASVLVLASTIERSQKQAGIRFKGVDNYLPKNDVVKYLLNEIGYWKYFDVPKLKTSVTQDRFSFFKILDDSQVDNRKIGKMIEFFERKVGFNGDARDYLSIALGEASANSVEHGYVEAKKDLDRWWLTANIDKETNTISFVFYDQGMGIFESVKNHKNTKLRIMYQGIRDNFKDRPKARILKKMLNYNYSKHDVDNRGYGLQTFRRFIDEAEDDGVLFIASENASYEYPRDILNEYKYSLTGTLIVWKLKVGYDINASIYLKGVADD